MIRKVSDLFFVRYGVNLEFSNMEADFKGGIPFVSRTSKNNGVVGFVKKIDGIIPNPKGSISVAVGGSVMESFLQEDEYYSGFHLLYLMPKTEMSRAQLLYYCTVLRANKYRYNYGRQANKTLASIQIPDLNQIPAWVVDKKIPSKPVSSPLLENKLKLQNKTWKWFAVSDLFDPIEKGLCGSAEELLTKGDEIAYVGAKKTDNGVMCRVKRDEDYVSNGNCIAFIGDGQGSVGYSTYQSTDFIGTTTLSLGRMDGLNPFVAMFLITILDKERPKYSFGRKWNGDRLRNTKIKLPANNSGEPDFQFMENYIKSLPYSKNLVAKN